MIEKGQMYKCTACGNIVEVEVAGGGTLVCCGRPMQQMRANTSEGATEKHVPVIQPVEGGYKVIVGSAHHPMLKEHYIEWIELVTDRSVLRKYLKPGQHPEAIFHTDEHPQYAREFCNLHGLWKGLF